MLVLGPAPGQTGATDASPSPDVVPSKDVLPSPDAFQRILWIRGGRNVDAPLAARIKSVGCNAVSVSSGQDPTAPGQHGLGFYRDQIVGKGILELRGAQFEPIRNAYLAKREDSALVRPAVLSRTQTLVEVSRILSERLGATTKAKAWAISLGDEVSVTRHANPLDLCFAPDSLRNLRAFLKARHRSIERLNAAWGTDFASFDHLRPFTADAIRARELSDRTLPANLGPWAAHREFMDAELARIVSLLVDQVGRRDAKTPCGLTGMQPPSAYGGHDYARLVPGLSFYEAYDIGGARDLAMSFAPDGAHQIATLFPLKEGEPGQLVTARLADMIAHGMAGTVVWSSGEVFTKDGLTGYGTALAVAFRTLGRAADRFAGAKMLRSPVWMVESQASVRAWWMLDSRKDGATWIKRLSSYEATHSTSLAARHAWIRMFEDLGLQPKFVAADELPVRLLESPPRLLVLPATIAMSNAVAEAIRFYVSKGGVVVADHTPGLYDQRLRLREKGALDEMFGVRDRSHDLDRLLVHEGRPHRSGRLSTGPSAAEKGLSARIADPVSGFQVQMEATHGTGRAYYLNLAMCEYGAVRLAPKRLHAALGLRKRVRHILRQANVQPPVVIQIKGMPTCVERAILGGRDGSDLLAVRVNALESPGILAELAKRGPYTAKLLFPRKVRIVDALTGAKRAAAFEHELPFDPYVGLFLEVQKP